MTRSNQQEWRARDRNVLHAAGFGNFDPDVVLKSGRGSRVWDEDGREHIDFLIGAGPMLVGHNHPEVMDAVQAQLADGVTFFTSNAARTELAEVICDAIPCVEQEATQ